MNRTPPARRRFLPFAALVAVGVIALAPHPASASVAVQAADLSDLFGGASSGGGYLNLSKLLGYALYIGIPTVAAFAGARVIMSIKDNPDLGHIAMGAMQICGILGFAIALWQLPTKMTGQTTTAANGAVIGSYTEASSPGR